MKLREQAMIRAFVMRLIVSATVLVAGAAWSAEPPPADDLPSITVTAPSPRKVPQLVARFGRPFSDNTLSRWTVPICPQMRGLTLEHAQFVVNRIVEIAKAAHVPIETGKCSPNLIVIVSTDDLALRKAIGKRGERLLNSGSRWPIDHNQLGAFVKDDGLPAHVFYMLGEGMPEGVPVPEGGGGTTAGTGLSDLIFGPPIINGYLPSRLTPHVQDIFTRVFVVVDGKRLVGFSLAQTAAYLTMVSVAEVRVDQPLSDVDTITAMFADEKNGRTPPSDLTFWDRAYLGALYNSPAQIDVSVQRDIMAKRIQHAIEVLDVPTVDKPAASQATPPAK